MTACRFFGVKWGMSLFIAVFVSGLAPVFESIPPVGPSSAFAAQKKEPRAKRTKSSRARKTRRKAAEPTTADDPTRPIGEVFTERMDAFFKANRPLYGSFVAVDPITGDVISLSEYSSSAGGRIKRPALSSLFPAASIFKIISSASLLESGAVGIETSTCYSGGRASLTEGNLVDRKRERACASLSQAFASSTNAVFGKLAVKHLKADDLVTMAGRFGFGKTLVAGGLTTTSRMTRPPNRLRLAQAAAGFTDSNMSPLHGAIVAAVIASGGKWPSAVAIDKAGAGESLEVIKPEIAAEISKMMVHAVTGGTANKYLSCIKGLSGKTPAVKTGTLTTRDGSGIWNNWYVGFYPSEKPEIAFAAHVGHSGVGRLKAGQITRYALKTWIELKNNRKPR